MTLAVGWLTGCARRAAIALEARAGRRLGFRFAAGLSVKRFSVRNTMGFYTESDTQGSVIAVL